MGRTGKLSEDLLRKGKDNSEKMKKQLEAEVRAEFISSLKNNNSLTDTEKEKILDELKEKYECPVCKKYFDTKAKLAAHLSKVRESLHEQYRQEKQNFEEQYKDSTDYLNIGCSENKCCQCKCNCLRYEYQTYQKVLKNFKREEKQAHKLQVHILEEEKKTLSKEARTIFEWFYKQVNNPNPDYYIEISKLKKLIKSGIPTDSIYFAAQLLIEQGNNDLRYLGKYVIDKANMYQQYYQQIYIEDTIPYFVKKYYDGINSKCTLSILGKDVERLNGLKKTLHLTINQIRQVIDYMISNNVPVFNFIDRIASRVLMNQKVEQEADKNIDYYRQKVIQQLLNGEITITEIRTTFGDNFADGIVKHLKNELFNYAFNPKFSITEWLYLIKYPLDKEIYYFAKNNNSRTTIFINQQYKDYLHWLQMQKNQFEV